MLALELSTAVRLGEMTLDKAQRRLREERFAREYPAESMKVLQERLAFTAAEMQRFIREAHERHDRVRTELRKDNTGPKPPLNI